MCHAEIRVNLIGGILSDGAIDPHSGWLYANCDTAKKANI